MKIGNVQERLKPAHRQAVLCKGGLVRKYIKVDLPACQQWITHTGTHHKMQVRTRVLIAYTDPLGGVIVQNAQTLISADIAPQTDLNIGKVPVFGCPAVAVIDLNIATGDFIHRPCSGGCHPKIGCIHSDLHVGLRGKVHRAAHFIIVRTGRRTLAAVIQPVK